MRVLHAHEYTQAAGRSGRLGLDTLGHVIHLNNLFRETSATSYKTMMNGKPQTLTSKFKISYNLLLNLIDNGDNNLVDFAKKSMITGDLQSKTKHILSEIEKCNQEIDRLKLCFDTMRTPRIVVEQYCELKGKKDNYTNKKRKEIEKEIQKIKDEYKYVEQDIDTLNKYNLKQTELNERERSKIIIDNYINNDVEKILTILEHDEFIEKEGEEKMTLTLKGKIASQLREVHCIVFANMLEYKTIDNLSSKQLVSLFSCFTNISVEESVQDYTPYTDDNEVKEILCNIAKIYNEFEDQETGLGIKTGADYYMHYDLLNYIDEWCETNCSEDCMVLLNKLGEEKGIFLGEFVKALLKINNISCEMEKIAEMTGNIAFLSKLREIPNITLKYVVTNQSLYV
jgi:superfamily II RNA helicase